MSGLAPLGLRARRRSESRHRSQRTRRSSPHHLRACPRRPRCLPPLPPSCSLALPAPPTPVATRHAQWRQLARGGDALR
ncbi:hypothetical protein PHLGIDRAFT_166986 [Phlebiopsis gigantea 11061_1 CR5-6]|uniref:Uncharacterized protein n=1 Tax=Phlebiopsis gigantea (strain 11061_1 CR5-6) TaxID=745531 RepID=A0A0C3S4P8_PHLG1|nr:hypothetical protein PHLGIDRAFT_166986 [Phlebiopsis gigantea 11061_1 CR5-6]